MELNSLVVKNMLANVIGLLEHTPLEFTSSNSIKDWRKECETNWSIFTEDGLSTEEQTVGKALLSTFLSAYEDLYHSVETAKHSPHTSWTKAERCYTVETLLDRPQVEQRTENWYQEGAELLTASQFATILKPGRTRGRLVLEKADPLACDTSGRRTIVLTSELNAFTWGIRFEPLVKQIYQVLTSTKVIELGRLKHQTIPRLAASPDGLVAEGPDNRFGRFVEFKAPVTRVIQHCVPEEYKVQMQIQMEVGNVEECDYLEVKFNSLYGNTQTEIVRPEELPRFEGNIYLIGNEEYRLLRYEYSPLKDLDWKPILSESECIVECIYWWSNEWYTTTIKRSREWFEKTKPLMESFWADVELAKQGKFVLPESSRPTKEKDVACKIIMENDEVVEEAPLTPCLN